MITISNQPQKFSPANNPISFQLASDKTTIIYFSVQVLAVDNSVIATQKYPTLPYIIQGTYFDLSSILSSYVDYQLVNTNNLIEPTPNISLAYKLSIQEYYLSFGAVVAGDTLMTGVFNTWNSEIKRTDFTDYDFHRFAISSGYTGSTQFLTNKPLVSNVYRNSTDYLYFLNDGLNAKVRLDFYGLNNTLIDTRYITGVTANANRLNISPSFLSTYFSQFTIQFTSQFGANTPINLSNYFTVCLTDSLGVTKSEIRTYVLKNSSGCKQTFQLFFSNDKGGFDSIDLFNPKEQISFDVTTIMNNPYSLNSAGVVTDINNGVYNETSTVINSTSTSTYTAITDVLSDAQARWLKDIITADKVYLRLANGRLLPVSLSNNSYSVLQKRYSTDNNRLTVTFKSEVKGLFE
jgi:hypothetical protein